MKLKIAFLSMAFAILSLMFSSDSFAADKNFKPGIIFSVGGKFDKSFNESAFRGAERFKKEFGIEYVDFEPNTTTQFEQAIRRLARRSDIVFVIGFTFITPIQNLAPQFPDTKFVIIDAVVPGDNVKSITFKEHEGSFLVGILAALKSQTGKVGFIGGQDVPLIRKFALGFAEGAKYANPNVEVISNMTGNTESAWSDPTRGGELAKSQMDRGVDVIFTAAGGTSLGVLQAASDRKRFSIGVDSNQNYRHPGSVLTSMLKNVDYAVYKTLVEYYKGEFTTGHTELGLSNNGVGYAVDQHNQPLLTDDMVKKVENAKQKIINGSIVVPDYTKKGARK